MLLERDQVIMAQKILIADKNIERCYNFKNLSCVSYRKYLYVNVKQRKSTEFLFINVQL